MRGRIDRQSVNDNGLSWPGVLMQSTVFKVLGGSLLTVAIVWALVLAWWQSNDHQPERLELILYLGALPLALIGGYWLLRGFIEHLANDPKGVPVTSTLHVDDDPLAGRHAKTAAAERRFALHLIDAFVTSAGGKSADEILAAIASGKRPEPNSRLVDRDGFPVFAAQVGELDLAAMMDEVLENHVGLTRFVEQSDVLRALALLDAVLEQACASIATLLERHPGRIGLQVIWLIPAGWERANFPELRAWLRTRDWAPVAEADLDISLIPAVSDAEAMRQLDEVILEANRNPADNDLIMLAAAASAVDPQSIESWEAGNILFTARHQDRLIPGEGAAVLLLATEKTRERLDATDSAIISRVSLGIRDKSVHAAGRIGGSLIEQLVTGLLDIRGIAASKVMAAVSDVDHRARHLTEMLEGLGATFPHFDPIEDCLPTGTVNGALAPVGSLIALACAREKVLAVDAPVLCLSNQHDRERAVLLAMPCSPPVDPEPCSI